MQQRAAVLSQLGRVTCVSMWRTSGFAWADFHDFDVMLPAAGRTTAFNPAPAVAVGGAPAAPTSKYKISQVLDQGDDTEFQAPSAVEVAAWNTNYFNQEQTTPIEEEEPTEAKPKEEKPLSTKSLAKQQKQREREMQKAR